MLYIVKKPLSIVCLPLHEIEYRKCTTPFIDPSGLGLPLRASLDLPGLFSSKSFCLVEQIIALRLGHPDICVFMKKTGATMRGGSWFCNYDSEFKICRTPVNVTQPCVSTHGKSFHHGKQKQTTSTDHIHSRDSPPIENETGTESDYDSADEKPDDLNFLV